ncbi:MAG: beta galactosidase jelly roll domain-containing protein [Bacteroidales bacterium]|nr:beta galactosidase jelly roll domain-containing protein [Bacteroidales bacterium]
MKNYTKNSITVLLLNVLFFTALMGNESLQVYTRETVSLSGNWNIIVDPYENGFYNYRWEPFDQMENPWLSAFFMDARMQTSTDLIEYNFDKAETLFVPGDWNTQDPRFYYYEGSIWYRKKFDAPGKKETDKVYLYFGAVNYRADVYLNGVKLGVHIGGFTPFHFEISDLLKTNNNSLVLKVDNKRSKEGVPTLNTDWWNYGGITRDVKLVVLPEVFIRDYSIKLESAENKKVSGSILLENCSEGQEIVFSVPELKIKLKLNAAQNGKANFSFTAKNLDLWSPDNPKLYEINIIAGEDNLSDLVGFRTISVKGKQLLLNDKPIFLKGISIHEEFAAEGGGRVNEKRKAEQLLDWALELGCNFVRLAHYPHNEDMIRLADNKGILVWSEIPVYWTIDWTNRETFANARNQLTENILRDRNRASVIIWSVSNETPVRPDRTSFLTKLVEHVHSLDDTRLVSTAMEKHYKKDDPSVAVVEDPLAEIVDIVSYNQYIGWYDGLPAKCDTTEWEIAYEKPVFISEFGGGAKYGYHGDADTRWTEEFQEDLYIRNLEMLDKIDGLCGMSPWILVDFRSPRRPLAEIQEDFNRKGLLSEKGEKKKAYFILQKYYNDKK